MKPQISTPDHDDDVDLHERAEAALGWIDEDASSVVTSSPEWAAQSCEELAPASMTGRLLGSSD